MKLPAAQGSLQAAPERRAVAGQRDETRGTASYRLVAWSASVLFCLISFWPREGPAKYRYSFLFLVPILWAVYRLKRTLVLRPLHFTLFACALLMHDLGAFGWYARNVAGLQFDWCVHFLFGWTGALIVDRILDLRAGLRGAPRALLVVLVITGIGGLHEIMEAASTMLLGEEYGMLHMGPGNQLDTQQDLLANVLGASVAVAIRVFQRRSDPRLASPNRR